MQYFKDFNIEDKLENLILHQTKKGSVVQNIFTFDIETTSAWIDDNGNVIGDRLDIPEPKYLTFKPISLCYEWTISIDDSVIYGRELADAILIFKKINGICDELNIDCIFWIHNAAFEFNFLLNYLTPSKVFARSPRHPMKYSFERLERIEFRCSFIATRLSLAAWGKQLGLPKLVGDLDYLKMRTPLSSLTEKEMSYMSRDCLVIYRGILNLLKTYEYIENIPLTQTGQVRKIVKKALNAIPSHYRFMSRLLPPNYEEYMFMRKCYWGAYTHGNMLHVNKILHDIHCYDFASSYPFVLLVRMYPMTPFMKCRSYNADNDKWAYLINVRLINVESKMFNHYLSRSKCYNCKGELCDNGRIISAESLEIFCTGEDFEMLKKCYDFDYEFIKIERSKKGYLPMPIIRVILDLYGKKTTYKDVEGYEDIYLASKMLLNSIYGMMVTDILMDDVIYKDGEWKVELKTIDDINNYLKEEKENPKRRNFLFYAWGIWCTAYARTNLWKIITHENEDGINNDYLIAYCDTDSAKSMCPLDNTWYNDNVIAQIKKVCADRHIDEKLFSPCDPKGIAHTIGIFEQEPTYSEAVFLGAKKYAYRSSKDNDLHITISGVPKGASVAFNNDISSFTKDFKFERDLNEKYNVDNAVGNYVTYWKDESIRKTGVVFNKGQYDEYTSYEWQGVNIRRKSYQMGMTHDFEILLDEIASSAYGSKICRF